MSPNDTNPPLEELAIHLYRTFVANRWAHAEQLPDGKYNTVYKPLDQIRIYSMLLDGESCLTYQLSSGALRWVCFDVDIKHEVLARNDYAAVKEESQQEVTEIASLLCDYLSQRGIPYLLEFSGNRGAHIWIIWKDFVEQRYGYALLTNILENTLIIPKCVFTTIDRFPQTAHTHGQLGKGVKLPLSKHQKSGFYSRLISTPKDLTECFNNPQAELDDKLIQSQSYVLQSFVFQTWSEIAIGASLNIEKNEVNTKLPAYTRQAIKVAPGQVPSLKTALNSLAKCSLLRPTIDRCLVNEVLSEKERAVMVGLLLRLQTTGRKTLGKELLYELFSKQPNFKPNLTNAKLSNLNLYPPTCHFLSQAFGLSLENCNDHAKCEVQKSPIELLEGCELEEEGLFSLGAEQFEVIRDATLRYAEINDEIDLYFLRMEMKRIDASTAVQSMRHFLSQQRVLGHYYKFERPESTDRSRTLVSLGAYEALLSAWFTKILDGLFGIEVSPHSYGYRFESSLSNANLFKPWFPQWIKYTKALSRFIENDAFDNYWVVKLDIRSFYSEISLARLRVKLATGPSRACSSVLQNLDRASRQEYDLLCSSLVEWCRVICGGDRGVPQGPAFARYLAELYLMQFDQAVEALMRIFQAKYFRWVDDIFLIVPDQTSAKAIDQEIRAEIQALSLAVNEEKTFLGTVSEYRARFNEYKNDSKYFVNQVSRNSRSSSSLQLAQAREALSDILETSDGTGVRPENASFFLTHLKQYPQGAAHFIPELLHIRQGRGSFFKHLFDHIVNEWRLCEYRPETWDFSELSGFRLEVFLNSLLQVVSKEPLNESASDNLSITLNNIQQNGTSQLAKSLLIHLMLSDSKLCANFDVDRMGITIDLMQCLQQRKSSEIADKILNPVLDHQGKLPIAESIEILHILMLDNQLSKAGYERSSDKFFALVLEQLEQHGHSSQTLDCLTESQKGSGDMLKKYHMLCCLCSVAGTSKNTEELKRVWHALICVTNQSSEWNPGRPQWIQKADSVEINPKNYSVLFAAGSGQDGVIPGLKDKHQVYNDYHYHLVVFLFAISDDAFIESVPTKADLLIKARNHGMLYLEWLLDPSVHVELYPNKKMCLKNIVENDITMLKRGNELLVRLPVERDFKTSPPTLRRR